MRDRRFVQLETAIQRLSEYAGEPAGLGQVGERIRHNLYDWIVKAVSQGIPAETIVEILKSRLVHPSLWTAIDTYRATEAVDNTVAQEVLQRVRSLMTSV